MFDIKNSEFISQHLDELVRSMIQVPLIKRLSEDEIKSGIAGEGYQKEDHFRLAKVLEVCRICTDPMLNLHFFNPYLKSPLSIFNYDYIFKLMHKATPDSKS